jgi:S1-C subfamily serine protease
MLCSGIPPIAWRAVGGLLLGIAVLNGAPSVHGQLPTLDTEPGRNREQPADPPDGALAVAAAMEQVVEEAIERAGASIVAIARERTDAPRRDLANDNDFFFPWARRIPPGMRGEPEEYEYLPTHFAAGVIISRDGNILTTYDALDDPQVNRYRVWHQGKELQVQVLPAEVQASDPWTDLAVIKVDGENLPAIRWGNANRLKVGSFVISLGNPYAVARDGRPSASWGIVANLQRIGRPVDSEVPRGPMALPESLQEFGTLIQVDARLNLGTSGGALINLRGELVGITTALAASSGYEQAAGYAIPIDDAMRAAVTTMEGGRLPSFGFLGIQPSDLPDLQRAEGMRGAMVGYVLPGLPGDQAGLNQNDTITSVNGLAIDGARALVGQLSRLPAGAPVSLSVIRPGRRSSIQLTALLGKKLTSGSRPGFSRLAVPSWRGLQVDTATAQSAERMFRRTFRTPPTNVAITRVDFDSPAWQAGLRTSHFIESVGGNKVLDPDDFYRQVESLQGPVELIVVIDDRPQSITVDP